MWLNGSSVCDFVDILEFLFSCGGGLVIFFWLNVSGCIIDIEFCVFISNCV